MKPYETGGGFRLFLMVFSKLVMLEEGEVGFEQEVVWMFAS